MLGGCRRMCTLELWGLEAEWQETDKIHGRFCKQVLRMPGCVADQAAKLELGVGSRRGNSTV